MKASRFNVFFIEEGYNICYNTFSKEYIILEDMLFQMYDAAFKNSSFEEILEVHPDFYNHLINKGFVVEDGLDEIAAVKEISYKVDNDDTKFELHINPTMNCNFKCWYCYETHIKDSKMDELTIANTEKFIKNIFEEKTELKEFHLSFFGGEPLLYFKKVIVPILKSTYELSIKRGVSFGSAMTTNGLLIDHEVIAICKQYGLDFFQITLDGCKEKHDKVRFISEGRGSYAKIVSNMINLAKNKLTVLVRINIAVDTLDGLRDIINDFVCLNENERKYLSFDLHKVWQVKDDIDSEIQEVRKFYRTKGFKVVSGTFDTVLNSCYGDHRNHATINYNGEAFKCTARDFTTNNSEGKLDGSGLIQWNEKLNKRLNSKFKNKPCLECRILPICGGGCSQQAIEHEGVDYCVYGFDENKKVEVVRNQFLEILEEIG
jgi:uncharacterized protein